MEDYIHAQEEGSYRDPTLEFHASHGARIEKLVPEYRPTDDLNQGNGVLISYDLLHRTPRRKETKEKRDSQPIRSDLSSWLESLIRSLLGETKAEGYDADRPFMNMGLDSADHLELQEQMMGQFGRSLPPTFFFQHNTLNKVVRYCLEHHPEMVLCSSSESPRSLHVQEASSSQEKKSVTKENHSVAIIGIACRLPGDIFSLNDLEHFLVQGNDAISELPSGRWNWPKEIEPHGKHPGIQRGGFLREIDCFDAGFFRISPREAKLMGPQQRILMELSWELLESTGTLPKDISNSHTGIFIGASGSDYLRLMEQEQVQVDAHSGLGTSSSIMGNRISWFYNLYGPSSILDTACSSSLVALDSALLSLRDHSCDQAWVGGVNIMCHPFNSIAYYKAGMLSSDGNCKTFDARANGYVRSEGAILIWIKPIRQALKDGNRIFWINSGKFGESWRSGQRLDSSEPGPTATSFDSSLETGRDRGRGYQLCGSPWNRYAPG